jgi:inosine-uridine nucleoside N-ribohydrolase
MVYKYFIFACLALCIACAHAQEQKDPALIIFDTDMGPDYDDVGALTLLHAFADNKEAKILATMASTNYEGVAAVLNVLNTYFKRPDIPLGVAAAHALAIKDFQHWTDTILARYPHRINNNDEAEDAVKLYRKILAGNPDSSIVIVTVGFLTNMSDLLQSQPDEHSPLAGIALVNRKVKRLVCMAGRFPAGSEFNIEKDGRSSKYAFEHWPGEIIFSGWEIGSKIKSGISLLNDRSIDNSPVKDVFKIGINASAEDREGRMSWDQTAVLVAVRGVAPWYTMQKGSIQVDEKGHNTWDTNAGKQYYLVASRPPTEVETIINDLMMHQPK